MRDGGRKGAWHLLPFFGLMDAAFQMEDGAAKYAPRNWEKGLPLSTFVGSGLRHNLKVAAGWTDEPHHRAWVWNALCFCDTLARIRLGELPRSLDDIGYIDALEAEEARRAAR